MIASDFYYANTIMHLSDGAIVEKVKSNLDQCEADFRDTKVVDYAVLRFPKAVTHFSPGSYKNRPFQVSVAPASVECKRAACNFGCQHAQQRRQLMLFSGVWCRRHR